MRTIPVFEITEQSFLVLGGQFQLPLTVTRRVYEKLIPWHVYEEVSLFWRQIGIDGSGQFETILLK